MTNYYTALVQTQLKPAFSFIKNTKNEFENFSSQNFNETIQVFKIPEVAFLVSSNHNLSSFNTIKNLMPLTDMLKLNTIFLTLISVILCVLIILTAIGNLFVIAAILSDRVLRNVQNYLVLSLALADLMVSVLVMPLAAVYEIKGQWTLGVLLCDIWTWADILCCTASILHLLAIAIDRYWAVTFVEYMRSRNPKKIIGLIAMVWLVALLISVGPLLGWKDSNFEKRLNDEGVCSYSQELSYQLFATVSTFYAPLIFILLLYWRIFQVARKRLRNKPGNNQLLGSYKATNSKKSLELEKNKGEFKKSIKESLSNYQTINKLNLNTYKEKSIDENNILNNVNCSQEINNNPLNQSMSDLSNESPVTTIINLNGSVNNTPIHNTDAYKNCQTHYLSTKKIKEYNIIIKKDHKTSKLNSSLVTNESLNLNEKIKDESIKRSSLKNEKINLPEQQETIVYLNNINKELAARLKYRQQQDSKRERKTAKILAIITGVFIICWLPFFALTLLKALVPKYRDYNLLFSIFIWLGWANSMINPIIYTIFSPDFRSAFKKLLFKKS